MKILVLGGTGAMGVAVVQILAERGHIVYVTTRKSHKSTNSNVIYIHGNAHNQDFVRKLLEYDYDAIVDFMVYSPEEFKVQSDLFLKHTKQYIFLSSARVYADANDEEISEEYPRLLDVSKDKKYLATNEYALAKAREEDMLLGNKQNNYTIVRPYITYNEERLQLGIYEKEVWLYRALREKAIVFSNDVAEKMTTLTYGYDVALRMVELIGNKNSFGKVYHITTNQTIQWKEVLNIYLDTFEQCTGKRPRVVMIDKCDDYSSERSYYQLSYDRLYNRHFNNAKITREVGMVKEFMTPQEGLKMCLENYIKKERKLEIIDWRREGALDKITGEKESIKYISGIKNKVKYILYRYIK